MITIPDFIQEAILGGINVTVMRHALYGICFDMNLMAKSHMHIVQKDGKWVALMRYDEVHEVEDVNDLKRLAEHGKHGRDFISADWAEFLMTAEQLAERKLARDALGKLNAHEQDAVKKYFTS
jgi:hypothetical protein